MHLWTVFGGHEIRTVEVLFFRWQLTYILKIKLIGLIVEPAFVKDFNGAPIVDITLFEAQSDFTIRGR